MSNLKIHDLHCVGEIQQFDRYSARNPIYAIESPEG